MANPENPVKTNVEYLDLVLKDKTQAPEYVLLPHERAAVDRAYQQRVDSFQHIIAEKVSVTGGDDWHDGAFRATDNEAKIITESMAHIQPFLGAMVINYPEATESRVTLGSRVSINQNGFVFPVDIVGYRNVYPSDVIDPESEEEVTAISPDSPLGQAILGKHVGDEATYRHGERTLTSVIAGLSQTAVRECFADSDRLTLEIEGN